MLVLIPHVGTIRGGARRWFDLKVFLFQPSEFAKIGLALVVASFFTENRRGARSWQDLVAGAVFLAIGVVLFLAAWIRQWSSEFAVTNKRVIIKVGFISRRTIEINMSKVESVEINQDILGRLLNYGTIVVIGTGGTKEPFALIDDPLAFRRAVQAQQN